jgi:hypothetical protein
VMARGGNAIDAAVAAAAAMTHRRAVQQRPRLGRVRARVGRHAAARPQRLGRAPGGLDARVLPRARRRAPRAAARGWDRSRCRARRRLGALASASGACRSPTCWRAPSRSPSGAARAGRHPKQVAARLAGARPRLAARLRAGVPAARPRPARGRALRHAGRCAHAARDRPDARRSLLPRRDRAGDRAPCARARRRDDGRRPRRVPARMGRAAVGGLPQRLPAARDPAQRTGHRRAHRAGHRAPLRPRDARPRRPRVPAPARRGDEARVRRHLPPRRRAGGDGGSRRRAARRRPTSRRAPPDRPAPRAGFAPGNPRAAAPSTSPRPTRAA